MHTNYGPVEPIEDLDTATKLAALLEEGGLCPLDIDVQLYQSDKPTAIETWHPDGPFAILGLTSRHTKDDDVQIVSVEVNAYKVLRNVAASAYNLGHLIPNDLGCISRLNPLILSVQCEPGPLLPKLAITLWGKIYDPSQSWAAQPIRAARDRLRRAQEATQAPSGFQRCSPAPQHLGDYLPPVIPTRSSDVPVRLLKALKLLKAHEVPVEDDELRALLDKYSSVL